MRAIVHIGLSWRGYYSTQKPKPLEELNRDQQLVREILKRMGYEHLFLPEQPFYDFVLGKGDTALEVLIGELNKRPDLASPHISVEKEYSDQELELAELLLWHPTNQDIKEDYYHPLSGHRPKIGPPFRECGTCHAPLEQMRNLIVKKSLMKKKHVSFTFGFEVILAGWLGGMLQEMCFTGFELWPVQHYRKTYPHEPTLYQLKITNVMPSMVSPPTEFERILYCEDCERTSQFLKHTHWWGNIRYFEDTDIYYKRTVLEVVKDFNHTVEWFGELPLSNRMILITQRVYRVLRNYKVKNWSVVPIYLVD